MIFAEQVPLAPLTTFKIGGPARYFATAASVSDIHEVLSFADERKLEVFVLGGGSNVLIADEGFPGLVLALDLQEVTLEQDTAGVRVTVGASVSWDAFIAERVAQQHSGLEALSGIPGTVGGAVVANAGAYGAQLSDVCIAVQVLDRQDIAKGPYWMQTPDCNFSYHDSIFSQQPERYVVLGATFRLAAGATPDFSYRDNRFNFTDVMKRESLPETFAGLRQAVLTIREQKGVLEHCYRSAGSFFHMPKVSSADYVRLMNTAITLDTEKETRLRPWAWLQTDGSYKVAPGFLLEYTPFQKGYVRGAVGISPKHTLSIINCGGATAYEVATLAHDMQVAVKKLFDISLEREVQYVGAVENKK